MVYHMKWLIDDEVLQVTFNDNFTVKHLQRMIDDLHTCMTAVNQPVHVIVDIAATYQFPTEINQLIPVAKRYYALSNLSHTVLVTDNLRLWMIGKMLSQICNRKQGVVTTRSVSAALDYLANQDDTLNVTPAATARAS